MKIDAVFSGGGVKAFAFLGALEKLTERGYIIERVGGTSAGAILAGLIIAKYSVEDIKRMLYKINFNSFLDPPIFARKYSPFKFMSLYIHKGLYKGNVFECWIADTLQRKGIVTFADIKEGYLKVVVSDVTKGRLVIIPDDLQRLYAINPDEFSVATAIRMSAGFPYFFIPKQLKNDDNNISYMVDGGLLSNFPLWLFQHDKKKKRPIIGVTLSETVESQAPERINNGLDMLQAMFKTMLKAHDTRYIATHDSEQIIFIPVKTIEAVDFNISDTTKESLMKLGRERTDEFFKTWSF